MFKTFCRLLPLFLAARGFAATTFSTPITGYVADSSGVTLRAVMGVPGGLSFSQPLPLPEGTIRVRVAPGCDVAWSERRDSSPALLLLKDGAVDRIVPVPGALPSADWMIFSAGGASAVLYSSASRRLQALTGLPEAPRIASDLDAAVLPEEPLTAAVSDDGGTLVTASGGAVYLVESGGTARPVLAGQRIHSLTMIPNSTDVLAADSATGSIYLLQQLGSAPISRVVAYDLGGVGSISTTRDGGSVVAVRPDAQTLSTIDIASGTVRSIALDATPESVLPLSNRDVFLTSSRPGETGCVFFRGEGIGHVLLIPPARTQAVQE